MVAAAVAVLMIAGHNVLAQEVKPEDASARELAKLNATMREVADLLGKQVAHGQLDLLMKRTQMALDQVERAETLLRQAQDERASVEERAPGGPPRGDLGPEKMPAEEPRRGHCGDRRGASTEWPSARAPSRQIIELQSRIAERQDELRGWQAGPAPQ
jgi:hypothetical protein